MTPDKMALLHAACFPDRSWASAEFENLLSNKNCTILWSDNEKAFVVAQSVLDEAEILTIAVDPGHHRTGLAYLLMQNLSRALAESSPPISTLFLEVSAQNQPARKLYKKLGFVENGTRRDYYRDKTGQRVDAVLMKASCPLVSSPNPFPNS